MTLKAHRLLGAADVIVYDKLVTNEILDLARRDAKRIFVGKSRANHSVPQPQIAEILAEEAAEGGLVVRLKGGDPFIFGRGGEEVEALTAKGVPVEVVPGITAASGCAAAIGKPLTHRDHASAVTFVAGQRRDLKDADWKGLAGPGRTLVVYMGLGAATDMSEKLIADGLAPQTPVAVIENGTRKNMRSLFTTLAELPLSLSDHVVVAPSLFIIGEVVGVAPDAAKRDEAVLALAQSAFASLSEQA
ncbi:MAG: uroporphyrinogen-III C-methyltransferase [Pseudomonadota bacterium]